MSSKTEQRANEILRLLLSRGKTSIEELSAQFETSSASIRRDLVRLEERGLVHRTHGGAMLADQAIYEPFRFDASFRDREERFAQEKQRIAAVAAAMIVENETIGFGSGTTTAMIARCLRQRSGLRVVTNALNIGMELSASQGILTTVTGGVMRWPGAFSLVGPGALEALSVVVMDRVFLGVCGVDAVHGATTIEPDEAAVFRTMTRQAKQVVVVADSSKVDMVSPSVICPVGAIDVLITDDGVAEDAVERLTGLGVKVVVV